MKKFDTTDPNWQRWGNSIAVVNHDCPKCAAPAGYYCVTPSGRTYRDVHWQRVRLLTDAEKEQCSVKAYTIDEVMSMIMGGDL